MRAVVVLSMAMAVPAHAQEPTPEPTVRLQAGGGGLVGFDPEVKGLVIDATIGAVMPNQKREQSFGGFGRLAIVYGNTDHGGFRQLRAGFDSLWCLGIRAVCLLVGVDFGAQWFPTVDNAGMVTDRFERVLIPRLGAETGIGSVRFHAAFEYGIYDDHDGEDSDYFETRRLAATAGFGIRFR